jgi:hypothetical protein
MKSARIVRLGPFRARGVRWLLAGVLAVGTTSCGRSEVIDHFGGLLAVSPPQVLDSAKVGDTRSQVTILHVENLGGGELRWRASLLHAANWLSFHPDSGVVGLVDSIVVEASPSGLASGVYRDTIVVFVTTQSVSGAVPVEFRVQP